MRQLPGAYWTEAHGPVFAYRARSDTEADAVTWADAYVAVHHDSLLPPRQCEGSVEIQDLSDAVAEAMTPHALDGGGHKRPPPRMYDVGDPVLRMRLHWDAIYRPGEVVQRGWGREPRAAEGDRR